MGAPIVYTYYPLNTVFDATNFGDTSLTAPANTNTTWGWNVGQLTVPRFSHMNFGVEVPRGTAALWSTSPTASLPDSVYGNCWVIGPFHGNFVQETTRITMSVKATTSATGQDGGFIYRFWKSPNQNGTGASLIDSSWISSSLVTNLTTTAQITSTSVVIPSFDLHNEYIFLHVQWRLTGAATNNNADVNFTFGSAATNITLPTYISHPTTNINFIQDEYPYR
jgi:hypothetical protein